MSSKFIIPEYDIGAFCVELSLEWSFFIADQFGVLFFTLASQFLVEFITLAGHAW